TSGCGRLGIKSISASKTSSAAAAAASAAVMRSPTPRCAAMAASRVAWSCWSRIAFDAFVRSARSVSTARIASRRRRSRSGRPATPERRRSRAAPSPARARPGSDGCRALRASPRRVERAAQMLDRGRLVVEADADDVEPHVVVDEAPGGDEVSRHAGHPCLLAGIDRLERRARAAAAAAAHLDEDQRWPVQGDQVDLAGPAAEVALHDGETLGAEQLGGERLASPTDLPPPIHGAGEYSRVNALARRD